MNDMSSLETRNVARDSLFLFAEMTFEGHPETVRVKVRNLSAGGLMADGGGVSTSRGARVQIALRNLGVVNGIVAWVQGDRFGVAFEKDIDPKVARAPAQDGEGTPRFVKPILPANRYVDEEREVRSI